MSTPRSNLILQELEKLEACKVRTLEYDDVALLVEEFLAIDETKDMRLGIDAQASCNFDILSIQGVCLHLHNLTRVAQVAPILGWFAKRGLKLTGKPEDYAEMQRRSWPLGKLTILGFFREGSGPGCRFVKVGEEMRSVYKLLCDEAETPEGESGA